jgi:hypothetical protein
MGDEVERQVTWRYDSTRRQEQAGQTRVPRIVRRTRPRDPAANFATVNKAVMRRGGTARGDRPATPRRDDHATDGTLWQRLVRQRGWTDERYAAWLGTLWGSLLVTG